MPTPINSVFRNTWRITELQEAFRAGDRTAMERIIDCASENRRLSRLLGSPEHHEEIKEGVVYKVNRGQESVIIKIFSANQGLPFQEMGGNLIATRLLETCPFFVRMLDMGRYHDEDYVLVMECLDEDTSTIDMDDPINMYNLFYQTAYACAEMEKSAGLQHFDLRFDNIMIRRLAEPKDLFRNGIMSTFVIKVGDFGQCEFDFGGKRSLNDDIPREDKFKKKWGVYPTSYSGYDFQYFLSTLTPVLDNHLSFYYIYSMAKSFLEPMTFTMAQSRPEVITKKSPKDVLCFLKRDVSPTLGMA